MGYTNGLDKEAFLQYMFDEFPSVFSNSFSREMLENIVNYGTADNFTHTKNDLYYFLRDMIPEVEPKDLIPFMDKKMLTDEVLCLVDGMDNKVKLGEGYHEGQHEWRVLVDGDVVYAFALDSENFVDINLDDLDVFIDECVDAMQEELGADSQLSDEDIAYLKGLMFGTWEELTDGMRYVGTMDELKGYFEKNGWEFFVYEDGMWEIDRQTPLGLNFVVELEHGEDVKQALRALQNYVDDFDVYDKADSFMEEVGARIPDALLEDMEKMKEMLESLVDGVGFLEGNKEVDDLIADATSKSNDLAERSNRCAVIRVFFNGEHVDNVFANFDDVERVCKAILNRPFADIEDNTVKKQWLKENGGSMAPDVTFEIDDDGPEYYSENSIEKD